MFGFKGSIIYKLLPKQNRENRDFKYFNGVVTKYLQNYLNWYSVIKKINKSPIPLKALIMMTSSSYQAMEVLEK
jgi:hypothetical protein